MVPFGEGPRKCIGDEFGMIMGTLALSSMAARWRLELPANGPIQPVLRVFLAPRDLRIRVVDRASHR